MNIGVLGGGQLGRMLALAGVPLGMRFRFFDPGSAESVQGIGEHIQAPWEDRDALARFMDGLDVATYEFENVPVATAAIVAEGLPLRPGVSALEIAQDRLNEKTRFAELDIPTNAWRPVDSQSELEAAVDEIGLPAVLKTRRLGYDGKGQCVLRTKGDVVGAFGQLGAAPCILEAFVDFDRELSLVAVREQDGTMHAYPLVENTHREGILVRTEAPADQVGGLVQARAERAVQLLADSLGYIGTLAVEFFQKGDMLLANEMAPRVHNSGHWTQDGAAVSQFENHLRAVCGLPIGSTASQGHTTMLNVIGAHPDPAQLLAVPGTRLHDYGKSARPGRKIGHINVVGASAAEVSRRAVRVEEIRGAPSLG